ncbi:MAG: flagellar biosynthetic protein FliR [Bacillota bacterium]
MAESFFLEFWWPFLLIFSRVAAFVAAVPIFGWRGIPVVLRIFFSFVFAVLLTLNWEGQLPLPRSDLELFFALGRQVFTGLLLGFLVYLFLSVFLMAGQFMDHKAGLMMAATFDPLFGGQVTLLGQFYYFMAVVLYLTLNGHHILFLSLRESFTLIPLAGPFAGGDIFWQYARTFSFVFLLAFQIAAPVIVVLWMFDMALGFLSRTVPQIHVFIEGLPLKIGLALLVFMLILPMLGGVMGDVFNLLARDLILVMRSWY